MKHIVEFGEKYNSHDIFINDNLKDALTETTNIDMSCAHLPVAKQIIFDKTVTLQLPQIGDIFLGIVNHKIIKKVIYILSNYSEEYIIEGKLEKNLWRMSHSPIVLCNISDYEHINIMVKIETNSMYNLHNSNNDVFLACYGYFSKSIKSSIFEQQVYITPLMNNTHNLISVCGIWTIKQK